MKFFDSQTIQLFLLLFIPGFISLKFYDLFVPQEEPRDFTKSIPTIIVYSVFNFSPTYLFYLFVPARLWVLYPW
ncbi:DUF6338 family protein [Magnetococcales bacterium HHB-1]